MRTSSSDSEAKWPYVGAIGARVVIGAAGANLSATSVCVAMADAAAGAQGALCVSFCVLMANAADVPVDIPSDSKIPTTRFFVLFNAHHRHAESTPCALFE
ncbi:hypothetical protein [Paraburkholderia sp. Ac-20347]|uniref:hypothetical protein n=1 Tax=Paraburkholderia sp. Ac-20347 TaxID=2703892 RepID=UPI00197E228B|nr:hypothetical protein [Paraburkholderia sp. Ac-20347]MBN3809657.1 hypothetical protein [Paraburkholderia sp. Ac-20347]